MSDIESSDGARNISPGQTVHTSSPCPLKPPGENHLQSMPSRVIYPELDPTPIHPIIADRCLQFIGARKSTIVGGGWWMMDDGWVHHNTVRGTTQSSAGESVR